MFDEAPEHLLSDDADTGVELQRASVPAPGLGVRRTVESGNGHRVSSARRSSTKGKGAMPKVQP
jgi:hypothetical protein